MTPSEFESLYALEEGLWWFVGMRRIVATLLGARARSQGLRILEAGCGTGFNAGDFARRFGWEVYPFDREEAALDWSARRALPRLARADVAALPYPGGSFDGVTCLDVLMMLPPPRMEQALAEFHRILRPGGFALIRLPALELLRGYHSQVIGEVRRYSLGELERSLRRAGFTIERATYANALLFPLALVKRRVLEPLHVVRRASDVRPAPAWLNMLFRGALALENRMLYAGLRLPVGVSALVLGVKQLSH